MAVLFSTHRLLIALAGSAVLTWIEWVEHHPPAIAIIALIHFVFVLAAIALVIPVARWFRRSARH